MVETGLGDAYVPHVVDNEEVDCYNYFAPEIKSKEVFSLILPPPNITGTLHLGHALTTTIQDVIVRWKRMEGVECVWVPGIDHAGIATQVVVEKQLWKEKRQSRHDVGREAFEERVWKWKDEKGRVIENQLRRLGASLDWNRKVFTMDPTQSREVTKAFIELFDSGLIYRADHLVNWSCSLQSAISDIEVDHVEVDGPTPIPLETNTVANISRGVLNWLGDAYVPHVVDNEEVDCYNYFAPEIKSKEVFSLILPPPNITGTLHLGHALTTTIQDVIVRWKRMEGVECVWVPGIDHAGIATQVVVEKQLWKEKRQSRHDVGREAFEERVWKWKDEKGRVIENQLRRLGASLDWNRKVFTMDPTQSREVTKAFIELFDSGLIYRADHLVNWSCSLQSAISDIEVDHVEVDGPTPIPVPNYDRPIEFGTLTYFAYKLHNSEEEIVVATTRPETMLGDVAVAVNPRDDRYARYIGRYLWHPFRAETIPVIGDDSVEPDFGTVATKPEWCILRAVVDKSCCGLGFVTE
ncbi:hypothetical protein Zmor_008439 [Zophobas morio]|uniref:valine--tRNA ligase n=1 Tax=Zophobas morio TaxID=2755281 RepID=A0AA38J182_9CUCU|nr:hypothetical protein Zmor_008439 [Zophobas morio]